MTALIDSATTSTITTASVARPAAAPANASAPSNSPAPAVDRVSLTGDALRMQQVEKALGETGSTEVDGARVARIRDAIANGTYRIDAQRIAAKMSRMDADLAS